MANSESYSRGMIKYSSRDYDSLMEEFWNIVPKLTDLWKPEADADPGVVLGKIIASTADMLGVNTDWLANELFAPTVSQRKNAEKIFGLIGYDLGWYTAAKTEVTFTNTTDGSITIDFGFNGGNFSTLNAYTDITNQSRTITYNIIPKTSASINRSSRVTTTLYNDAFAPEDKVTLASGESVIRVAIEGELRSYTVTVSQLKKNNYMIRLPSQHLDTTAIWVKSKNSGGDDTGTQWVQCTSPSEFIVPEPRFAVTYDNYSNAQVQISNYINQLESYESNSLIIYWIDCSGVIGSVGTDVLTNFLPAKPLDENVSLESGDIAISNLSNTIELPNTNVVTGKSPETAKEAYRNSRNYINTWDSLITLPDFNRFLNREPGVNCGVVIDCQKALDINLAIYNDKNLTDKQKKKQYITNRDFPEGDPIYNWDSILGFDPTDPQKYTFAANFKPYTAMCFAIHNNFKESNWGRGQTAIPQTDNSNPSFVRYKPPIQFVQNVIKDYRPLQAMSVQVEFGYARIFNFYVVGTITPNRPVSSSVADVLIAEAKEALALYFHPDNREFGQKPTIMEIVDVIEGADAKIRHFDPGSTTTANGIVWNNCDIEYFNPISFARYIDDLTSTTNIRVNPDYITD